MGYTRSQIEEMCRTGMKCPQTFYREKFVNYRGKTEDTAEYYTEVAAQFVSDHMKEFLRGIVEIKREADYRLDTHDGVFASDSVREEEITAMKLFNASKDGCSYAHIGKIIDYQTPLKSKRTDDAGKVDLLAYDGIYLRLLELKKEKSDETMLRCVLEGFTYLWTVDEAKLLWDFNLPDNTVVKACPFVFAGSRPHLEYQENRPWLKKLMAQLDSVPFFLKAENSGYTVLSEVEANEN